MPQIDLTKKDIEFLAELVRGAMSVSKVIIWDAEKYGDRGIFNQLDRARKSLDTEKKVLFKLTGKSE